MSNLSMDKNKNKTPIVHFSWNKVIFTLLVIYLILVFYVTLFAWNYGSSYGPVGPGGRNYNLTLFESIYRIAVYSPDMYDPILILGGNFLMFIPFGILISLWFRGSLSSVWYVLLLSVLLSSFIEVNQFIFTYRVANIDDVLLNTMGGVMGAWFIVSSRWFIKKIVW
ncbi:VanZ family protein [Alteribacillus iranensis]|uniref:Glycopeptide antibiotics resistance protein n=1 Tax=Alteribacillus iranensis TaxID=930128 RepID=A0A1I2A0A2_9BACI|nr:VanZ family protein [Alteribacillus iranensis]SFE37048.1 Glycopeptide antibiotics resistance protein [Alteribacillus iranensis]